MCPLAEGVNVSRQFMQREGEVLVAFVPQLDGSGSVMVYADPFDEQPALPVEIIVSRWSTPSEVMRMVGNVLVAWGYMRKV